MIGPTDRMKWLNFAGDPILDVDSRSLTFVPVPDTDSGSLFFFLTIPSFLTLLERLALQHISPTVEGLLSADQAGFRKGLSTWLLPSPLSSKMDSSRT